MCLIAFAVMIACADFVSMRLATGHFPNPLQQTSLVDGTDLRISRVPRLSRNFIIRMARLELVEAGNRARETAAAVPAFPVSSAAAKAMRVAGLDSGKSNQELPNLVIVVVESWGLAVNTPLQQALIQPYLQPNLDARYEVDQGTVPFYGPTIAGEARELCGNSIGFHLMNASANELKGCLPGRLAALGYHTIALHGMNGHMYRRSSWYKTIGFQERWFNDQLKEQGLPDCMGAIVGTCDANLAEWIGRRLAGDDSHPYFVHWMTLNSHLPVLVPSTLPAGAPCLSALSLRPDSPLCSWYQLVANVHQSISQLAMSNLSRPTVFVIVGDHAPPFADPSERGQFSASVVPYVLLIPRSNSGAQDRTLARSSFAEPERTARFSSQNP
jgi:hypothetical protein